MIHQTSIYKTIHEACDKSLSQKSIDIIIGKPGLGKTIAAEDYCNGRQDTLLIRKSVRKTMAIGDAIELVIIDGLSSLFLSSVCTLVQRYSRVGFVIIMDQNHFLSISEDTREKAYKLVSFRSEIVKVLGDNEPFDITTRVKLKGAIKDLKGDRDFLKHFIVSHSARHSAFPIPTSRQAGSNSWLRLMKSHRAGSINTIYILRRPTDNDVLELCQYYGKTKGSRLIYQKCRTLTEVLNQLQTWRESQSHN